MNNLRLSLMEKHELHSHHVQSSSRLKTRKRLKGQVKTNKDAADPQLLEARHI